MPISRIPINEKQMKEENNKLMYYDYDSNVEGNLSLNSSIKGANLGCAELHLFSSGLASVKNNKRTMLLVCNANSSEEGMNIIHYTKETGGEYQSVSPKKYST